MKVPIPLKEVGDYSIDLSSNILRRKDIEHHTYYGTSHTVCVKYYPSTALKYSCVKYYPSTALKYSCVQYYFSTTLKLFCKWF